MSSNGPVRRNGEPRRDTDIAFGKRLYAMMADKGWSQSELSRRAGLTKEAVSTYINGKARASDISVHKLAKALAVTPEDLHGGQPDRIDTADPDLEMRSSPNKPGYSWLRMNRLVKNGTAARIIALLEADESAH